MLYEKLSENSIFAYFPQLEPVFGVYSLLLGEPGTARELFGDEQCGAWQAEYRFLWEAHSAVSSLSSFGFLEFLLEMPLEGLTLARLRDWAAGLPAEEFLYRYLDWEFHGSRAELKLALTDEGALSRVYEKISDRCPSFLGFSAFFRGSDRYIREFFSLAEKLWGPVLEKAVEERQAAILQELSAARREVQQMGPLEFSQLRMGKTFRNRGPYSEFFFLPTLLMPLRACRFFQTGDGPKRQILFLSLNQPGQSREGVLRGLKALSDGTRYQILTLLAQGTPLRGLDIAQRLSLAPSTVSHHMEQLKESGLITEEPVKTAKYYGLSQKNLEELVQRLSKDFKIE